MARRSSAPIGRSPRSATRASSASSPGCGSATTSRITAASSRACGACWNATLPGRSWSRCATGSTPMSRRTSARSMARGGMSQARERCACAPKSRRGPAYGDDHGGGARQAHAPADRDPAQAADRGRRQGAARPCARKTARRRRARRWWSTFIIWPTRWRRILRPARTASRSSSPTSATCCWKPAGGWSRPRR